MLEPKSFQSIESVNDFVIKFANVNGTGSASANQMFAKAIFRMGIPVSPKNIFPSNIQGLPTWFEVRVSEKGYLGQRGGVDIAVAMNPQSYSKDIDEISEGGYLLYDSTWKRNFNRSDINIIEIPLTQLCVDSFKNPKQRALFKNIAYVGALSALMEIEYEVLETIISEQFANKPALIEPNIKALNLGRDYVLDNLDYPIGIKLSRRNLLENKILISGNEAAGLGAVYGGATFCSWYPITPSTSLAEGYEKYAKKYRVDERSGKNLYASVQAEDELAAVGMAIGANWNGARAFTATSGPGISLMSEFLGLAYFAEIPLVVFNVQRGGPSTGMPTRTQQSDVLACAYASHGDTKHVLLFPADPKDCFDFSAKAFDLADQLQTPVFVVSDLDMGMNDWVCEKFDWDDSIAYNRGKVLNYEDLEKLESYGRYLDSDNDGICYRTYPGTHPEKGAYFTRGTSHDEYARYTEDGNVNAETLMRLMRKFRTASELVPEPLIEINGEDSCGIIFYGSSKPAVLEAKDILKTKNINVDLMQIRSFPFNLDVWEFIANHDRIYVVEQNRDSQMRTLIMAEGGISAEVLRPLVHFTGDPIEAAYIVNKVSEREVNYKSHKNIKER
jgi:2-oxoglutarate ferredoxin oxidoreductase subunit alpha